MNTNNVRVISYENERQGVYKYFLTDPKKETYELQRFIKRKNLDLNIKVEVRDVTIPERNIETMTCDFRDNRHEMIVVLQGPENGKIWCSHDVIEHSLVGFFDYLMNYKKISLKEIEEVSIYTKGLCETLELIPCSWGCDDPTYLIIREK